MIQKGPTKILIIRFSSFGDVVQSLSLPTRLAELGMPSEIHWVTRKDMAPLLEGHPFISKIWTLDRAQGLVGLFQLISELKKQRFTHIYDAHNNLRSRLISLMLQPPVAISRWLNPPLFIRKSQKRLKRFLLFKLRLNTYEMPFSGQRDLLEPLTQWGLNKELPPTPQIYISDAALSIAKKSILFPHFIAVAPSAAHALKRWPLEHFKKLIALNPEQNFVCLGGPEDSFIQELSSMSPQRVLNLAGKLSITESAAVILLARGLITNDTGLLHVAEQLGKKTIALMGPAPFGFPSRSTTKIMQLDLDCRPCSKHGQGPCVNSVYHRCLVEITPTMVQKEFESWL